LDQARNEFNAGAHNSRKRLEVAQYEFDTFKKQSKHEDKASKTLAKQHPHLPVVQATEQSGDSVVNAIHDLQTSMEEVMRVNTDRLIAHSAAQHQQSLTCLMAAICELRETRIVSSSVEFHQRFPG
jgi:hypothetical protein